MYIYVAVYYLNRIMCIGKLDPDDEKNIVFECDPIEILCNGKPSDTFAEGPLP